MTDHITRHIDAQDYLRSLKYDNWELFMMIPGRIKREVIIQMDECMNESYTFIWEGDFFKKVQRYQYCF